MTLRSTLLLKITALLAFSSLLHELNLAQTLSACLGGTLVRYSTTVGLFTFSLGMGALLHEFCFTTYPRKSLLLQTQLLLGLVGSTSPWIIVFFTNQLGTNSAFLPYWVHFPVLLIGLLSGFELPLLMRLLRESGGVDRSLWALASDYLGMFAASLLFPLVLLPELGVFWTASWGGAINLFGAFLTWRLPEQDKSLESVSTRKSSHSIGPILRQRNTIITFWIVFALSFCSLCYELILARAWVDLIQDDILSQSVSIGVFLLGMGVGTAWISSARIRNPWRTLFFTEIALSSIGALLFAIITLGSAAGTVFSPWLPSWISPLSETQTGLFFLFQSLTFLIGVLTGFELPLLLRTPELLRLESAGWPMAINYMGALIAGLAIPILLIPELGMSKTITLIACLNCLCAIVIFFYSGMRIGSLSSLTLTIPSLLLWMGSYSAPYLEQIHLKIHYGRISLSSLSWDSVKALARNLSAIGSITRYESAYQNIDLVHSSAFRINEDADDFSLYLNGQPQFSSSIWSSYHDIFIQSGLLLEKSAPNQSLILGGGDGLLARKLLELKTTEQITLVELDPLILRISQSTPEILALNANSLSDPRLKIIVDDAYRFVHSTEARFDAVFIDLPYPVSFDLSRVFSVEFYSAIRRILKPHGYVVLDAPIWKKMGENFSLEAETPPTSTEVLLSTVRAAGFMHFYALGPIDPVLLLSQEPLKNEIDYSKVSKKLANRSYVNLKDIHHITQTARVRDSFVNSVYAPKRFK